MSFGIRISVDATRAVKKLKAVGIKLDNKEMLSFIGEHLLYWVDHNFQNEGTEKKWAKLSDNTLAGRRKNGRVAKILQDTGRLKMSFVKGKLQNVHSISGNKLEVGSEDPRAIWHHKGTDPYDIYPKNKEALSFVIGGMKIYEKRGGLSNRKAVVKHVHHPGLIARPLIPSDGLAQKIADKAVRAYVKVIESSVKGMT